VEQVAHVLSIQGGYCITCVERRLCLITGGFHALPPSLISPVLDGEQSNGNVGIVRKVLLTKHLERLVCDHLQRVTQVMAGGRHGPRHPAWLFSIEWDVNADLAMPNLELAKNMTVVIGLLLVAEALQHISQQAGKSRAVQPVNGQQTVRTNTTEG
jgi:hypothetical protein